MTALVAIRAPIGKARGCPPASGANESIPWDFAVRSHYIGASLPSRVHMRVLLSSLAIILSATANASAQLPRLAANDNRTPAGSLAGGVLTLSLEIGVGRWHPDAEDMPGIDLIAIRDAGRTRSVPARLIRVPLGTEVRAS